MINKFKAQIKDLTSRIETLEARSPEIQASGYIEVPNTTSDTVYEVTSDVVIYPKSLDTLTAPPDDLKYVAPIKEIKEATETMNSKPAKHTMIQPDDDILGDEVAPKATISRMGQKATKKPTKE